MEAGIYVRSIYKALRFVHTHSKGKLGSSSEIRDHQSYKRIIHTNGNRLTDTEIATNQDKTAKQQHLPAQHKYTVFVNYH